MSETQDSILPCPICSTVVRRPNGQLKPIIEVPMLHYAHMKSDREGADWYVWNGCVHAIPERFGGEPIMEASMRSLAIARWNVHARKLYDEKTFGWSEQAIRDFGQPLGFVS